jgi:hypothetical protein
MDGISRRLGEEIISRKSHLDKQHPKELVANIPIKL